MSLLKRIAGLSMAAIMAASVLAGCGQGGTTSSTESSKTESSKTESSASEESSKEESSTEESSKEEGGETGGKPDYSDPTQVSKEVIKPSFMLTSSDYSGKGDEIIWQTIKHYTNIEFQVIPVPLASWKEKEATTLASGNLPDIMGCRSYKTVDKYGPQGAFLDLEPYIEKGMLQNYVEVIDSKPPSMKLSRSPDGKRYGAPRIYETPRMDEALLCRVDVLERLNLSREPKDFDELLDIMRAIKAEYPDSTPYMNRWEASHLLANFASMYNSGYAYVQVLGTDGYVFGADSQNYKDCLKTLTTMYAEGLLDKDFATLTDEEYEEKLITSRAFMAYDYQDTGFYEEGKAMMEEGWNWGAMIAPPYNGEFKGYTVLEGYYGYVKAISANSQFKDELVRFFDWTYAEAGQQALMFGIEGDTYEKKDDGSIELLKDIKYAGNLGGTVMVHGLNDQNIFSAMPANAAEFFENVGQFTIAQKEYLNEKGAFAEPVWAAHFYDEAKEKQYNDIRTQVETYILEESTKVIQGQSSIDDWDKVIETAKGTYQAETGLELINEAYKDTFSE